MFNAHEFLVFTKVAKMFGAVVDTDAAHGRVTVGRLVHEETAEGTKSIQLSVVFDPARGAVVFHTNTDEKWHSVPQSHPDRSTEWYVHLRLLCSGGVQLR